jgi:PIN domain nuclease of toxin-antitoxin system
VRLLLDSHALLWWMNDSTRLGASARRAIGDAAGVAASLATVWEIAIKAGLGKLSVGLPELLANIARDGFEVVPVTAADCLAVAGFPRHHGDPFDRMLIAQARGRGLALLSDDPSFAPYGVHGAALRVGQPVTRLSAPAQSP